LYFDISVTLLAHLFESFARLRVIYFEKVTFVGTDPDVEGDEIIEASLYAIAASCGALEQIFVKRYDFQRS
jgi:hypothetical protein